MSLSGQLTVTPAGTGMGSAAGITTHGPTTEVHWVSKKHSRVAAPALGTATAVRGEQTQREPDSLAKQAA